ncbi:glycosyltransferase family 4 protein [Muricoccus nepalensis]|nr:glycosyltransferase family 1 protein [Roseomonas nepalensis]
MTLEIIRATRYRPELARLDLLLAGRLRDTGTVLAQVEAGLDPVRVPSPLLRFKRLVADVPGVQAARRLKHLSGQRQRMAALRSRGGGRVVYHEPNMIPELFYSPFEGPTVVTMNDLSWHHHPEYHPPERLRWIDRNLRRMLDGSARFVAISHFTAGALVQEFGISPLRIDVVPLAAGREFRPVSREDAALVLQRHGLEDRHYFLSVSTLEPRKNFDRLVAAHDSLPMALRQRFPLVIVGGSGWGNALANPLAQRARDTGTLRLLGHVPDADLVILYARAAAFAYVSIYEGFGLPVVEAMATGTPVLASSTTATGETAGDAAALADPLDVHALTVALRRLADDKDYAETLRARGLARAAEFSWDRTASGLIASWSRALA